MTATIHHGDCLDVLRAMPDNSVHAIVTDPPYGLSNTTPEQVADTIVKWVSGEREYLPSGKGFMGKEWDGFVPPVAVWDEAMRVLKPGGHVLAFAGTRTMDLMTLGLRLAGFDIRESLAWLFGSGMPKSHNISKALDKMAGAEREVVGQSTRVTPRSGKTGAGFAPGGMIRWGDDHYRWEDAPPEAVAYYTAQSAKRGQITAPATEAAKQWHGWGSATKPAFEPVIMARKPFRGTLAANVLEHGTGGLNIDATRIGYEADDLAARVARTGNNAGRQYGASNSVRLSGGEVAPANPSGRWPANVILDEEMAGVLDEQSGVDGPTKARTGKRTQSNSGIYGAVSNEVTVKDHADPGGGASRFFYVAKAPKRERPVVDGVSHPTTKPLTLMKYLVRMVTPPDGIVLDPFAGSGTTIEAAMLEGFQVIGIEREAEYLPLIRHRVERAQEHIRTEQQQQAEAPDQGAFPLEDIA